MLPSYVRARPGGSLVFVRVVPRSARTGIGGRRAGALLLRVAAAPVEGAANAAVVEYLAGVLDVPRRAVTILRGEKGRDKLLSIDGLNAPDVAVRLEPLLSADPPAHER